jgi:hypothetical protein
LQKTLKEKHAEQNGEFVTIPKAAMDTAIGRGKNTITRYKINPVFFVRTRDIKSSGNKYQFRISAVNQNTPSCSPHMKVNKS